MHDIPCRRRNKSVSPWSVVLVGLVVPVVLDVLDVHVVRVVHNVRVVLVVVFADFIHLLSPSDGTQRHVNWKATKNRT